MEYEFSDVQAEIDAQKTAPSARDKVKAFKHLQELFATLPDDIDLDKVREERLK